MTVSFEHRIHTIAKFSRLNAIRVPSAEISPAEARLKSTVPANSRVSVDLSGTPFRFARYSRVDPACLVAIKMSPEIGSTIKVSASYVPSGYVSVNISTPLKFSDRGLYANAG